MNRASAAQPEAQRDRKATREPPASQVRREPPASLEPREHPVQKVTKAIPGTAGLGAALPEPPE